MTATRVLGVILGVLVIIGGIYLFAMPVQTYLSLAWVLGAVMIVDGVFNAVTWSSARRLGQADGLSLVGAIVSIVFGVLVLGSLGMQLAVDLFIALAAAFWIIISGILRIIMSLQIRKGLKAYEGKVLGGKWYVSLILGIVLVILGILCILDPFILALAIGWLIGIAFIVGGITIISLSV